MANAHPVLVANPLTVQDERAETRHESQATHDAATVATGHFPDSVAPALPPLTTVDIFG